jgi:uncharacterized protein DUF6221
VDDLVQWLHAQLDADERIVRTVEDRSAPWDGQWMADGDSAVRTVNGHVLFYRHDSGPLKPGLADHVAEWDPARVLREIDAKRWMVEVLANSMKPDPGTGIPRGVAWSMLRRMAEVYQDRPGWQSYWPGSG